MINLDALDGAQYLRDWLLNIVKEKTYSEGLKCFEKISLMLKNHKQKEFLVLLKQAEKLEVIELILNVIDNASCFLKKNKETADQNQFLSEIDSLLESDIPQIAEKAFKLQKDYIKLILGD